MKLSKDLPPPIKKLSLVTLPPELHLKIFDLFSDYYPVDSTCLGLTCKKFYPIHRAIWGSVSLSAWQFGDDCTGKWAYRLENLLEDFKPPGLYYCPLRVYKWLTKERYEEVMEEISPSSKREPFGATERTWDLYRPWVSAEELGT